MFVPDFKVKVAAPAEDSAKHPTNANRAADLLVLVTLAVCRIPARFQAESN
jgi:hypothetical protein